MYKGVELNEHRSPVSVDAYCRRVFGELLLTVIPLAYLFTYATSFLGRAFLRASRSDCEVPANNRRRQSVIKILYIVLLLVYLTTQITISQANTQCHRLLFWKANPCLETLATRSVSLSRVLSNPFAHRNFRHLISSKRSICGC